MLHDNAVTPFERLRFCMIFFWVAPTPLNLVATHFHVVFERRLILVGNDSVRGHRLERNQVAQ